MATGAACQLSSLAGVPVLRVPLLLVAIAIAVGVTVASVVRARRRAHGRTPLAAWLGRFTVPVGLAVITAGLSTSSARPIVVAAWTAAVLAVASTAVVVVGAVVAAHTARPTLPAVNGVWFIAPAAFLADAVACTALHAHAPSAAPALGTTAIVSAAIGAAGYAILLVVAAVRVGRHGLSGAPRVAWWIVTGCGGLAAFSLGRVAATFGPVAPWSVAVFHAAALASAVVAAAVLIPITVGCVRFLVGLPRRRLARSPWPPAFSSGVFALGAAEIGSIYGWTAATTVGRIAAVETLVVWAAIAAVNIAAVAASRRPG